MRRAGTRARRVAGVPARRAGDTDRMGMRPVARRCSCCRKAVFVAAPLAGCAGSTDRVRVRPVVHCLIIFVRVAVAVGGRCGLGFCCAGRHSFCVVLQLQRVIVASTVIGVSGNRYTVCVRCLSTCRAADWYAVRMRAVVARRVRAAETVRVVVQPVRMRRQIRRAQHDRSLTAGLFRSIKITVAGVHADRHSAAAPRDPRAADRHSRIDIVCRHPD